MAERQAVLVIHGIGEQRPMETLRGFVRAVWSTDGAVHSRFAGDEVWSKPDGVSRSFELRRLTTPRNKNGIRTDFFEFYWAHHMRGTTWLQVWAWTKSLLGTSPLTMPKHLRPLYGTVWAILVGMLVAVSIAVGSGHVEAVEASQYGFLVSWGGWILFGLLGYVGTAIVGDAAVYLDASAANVARRHEIRAEGVRLLEELGRRYSRVIVVGHSLGSVIGYDILHHYWSEVHAGHASTAMGAMTALAQVERRVVEGRIEEDVEGFQRAQRDYARELVEEGSAWRVTDFVTLGSPLAHAAILMAKGPDDLISRQAERELPTCPPVTERIRERKEDHVRFSFRPKGSKTRVPHHAAPFSAVRWTNLFFRRRWLLWGDLVAGPVAPWFGPGVHDIEVPLPKSWMFAHTKYWSQANGSSAHIDALRQAVNLLDE